MKKLLTSMVLSVALLLAAGHSAHADEKVCGTAEIGYIMIFESNSETDVPVHPCLLEITILTNAGQTYVIPAKAFGTQLNIALLKAFNFTETVSICLRVNLYPFKAEIVKIDFGERAPRPPKPPKDGDGGTI